LPRRRAAVFALERADFRNIPFDDELAIAKAERALPPRGADIRRYGGNSHNASANTASIGAS
jgi:hypothetical protein